MTAWHRSLLLLLLFANGCRSMDDDKYAKEKAEYQRKMDAWRADDQRSRSAWSEATGGGFRGGTPLPEPKEPKQYHDIWH